MMETRNIPVGIQINQKELTEKFMMISNWKNIWLRCFLQINLALQGLNTHFINNIAVI